MASVEVFILNYNGNSFLEDCLMALRGIDRGGNTVTVNVVDNKSPIPPDDILANFPEVNYIPLDFNGGFSTGNNLGVWERLKQLKEKNLPDPDYIVFLNNDTKVDKDWISEAVKTLDSDKSIGVLGAKAIFMDQFVKLSFKTKTPLKFEILSSENVQERRRFKFKGAPRQGNIYTINDGNELFVPIVDDTKDVTFSASISNDSDAEVELSFKVNEGNDTACTLPKGASAKLSFSFTPSDYRRVIQNAGSYLTKEWMGGDLGFLEMDNGQYSQTEERQAICGVSMFFRTDLFKKLKGFDQKYFAYFEDTDLSLRARLAGYRCVFEPKSKLLHLHCGSSTEYSDYFNLNVNWSYFLFTSRYASLKDWLRILVRYLRQARHEFSQFQQDKTLDGKYNLRTMGRLVKSPSYFIKNRLRNLFINSSKLQEKNG